MTRLKAKCSAIVPNNGIVRFLLTIDSAPPSQDEHIFFNLLKSRVDFEQGDTIEVTIRKVTR
jgi:hypothetical protein